MLKFTMLSKQLILIFLLKLLIILKIRNLIKAVFFVSALINLPPAVKATEFSVIDKKNITSQSESINWDNLFFNCI